MAAWTVLYSGSASISTGEYSLTLSSTSGVPASKTDKATITPVLDLNAMVAGDQYEMRIYDKCRSGDTQRQLSYRVFTGANGGSPDPLWMGPALMIGDGWDITLKRLAGSDRTIGWSIRAYG